MSDTAGSSTENIDVVIKSSSDKKYTLSLPISTRIEELKAQLAQQSDIPADRQRLIFAGRVLKDNETLEFYKIKSGQTIHLVKGAAPPGSTSGTASGASTTGASATGSSPSSNSSNSTASQVPGNIAAGAGSGNLLADLTGARYAGLAQLPSASMFGPDGGMGAGANSEQLLNLMEEPGFAQHMQQALQNPAIVDLMINSNPQLRQMGPQFRQMLQSPEFVQMMSNPQTIRTMMQMERMFGGAGAGAGGAGANSFPAPGSTDNNGSTTTDSTASSDTSANAGTGAGANPFGGLFPNGQTPDVSANPFAALLNPQRHANAAAAAGGADNASTNQFNQFNPALLASLLGGNAPAPEPQDDRPPEERYESQLRQLNELGFFDFDRNVRALRRSGGNVQGAVEALLDGQV
ncbi:Dsk2p [Sugiyamaella lignohabitans]|uniref:Dsk2p n=1 Tax=Sugiyamaella lignohabitans TaxID=796027 RepID=A0A167CKL2_9ASCO|nr:Dsk2p [Sugiyamaella lignohabitans]ANB11814.1 Dsk2p [Sugiyamaella lignohabitans]